MIQRLRFSFVSLLFSVFATAQDTIPGDHNRITIYLTFDDGPIEASHFLDSLLIRDSIPLAVFIIGFRANTDHATRKRLEMYKRQPLIQIANHSYSHASDHYRLFYANHKQVVNDITRNRDSLKFANNIVRLPGRNTWRINGRKRTDLADANASADSLAGLGYILIGWDIEWRTDTCKKRYYSAAEIISQLQYIVSSERSFEKDHVVILCHDWALTDSYFRDELKLFVQKMKKTCGVKFAHLSSYPGTNINEAAFP